MHASNGASLCRTIARRDTEQKTGSTRGRGHEEQKVLALRAERKDAKHCGIGHAAQSWEHSLHGKMDHRVLGAHVCASLAPHMARRAWRGVTSAPGLLSGLPWRPKAVGPPRAASSYRRSAPVRYRRDSERTESGSRAREGGNGSSTAEGRQLEEKQSVLGVGTHRAARKRDVIEEDSGATFGVTSSDLQFICSRRGKDEVYACGVAGSKEQLAAQLGSCLTSGIPHEDPDDMKRRCDAFGTNTLPEKEALTFWQALAEAYDDFTLQTLTAAGIASIAIERASNPGAHLQDYMEGLAILGAVVVCVVVVAVNNYQKESQFRALNAAVSDRPVCVVRGGEPREVSSTAVVPGDILLVDAGDIMVADGVLVAGSDVRVDESHLTGESEDVAKDTKDHPLMLSGSRVMHGSGRVLVLAVGCSSQQGQISELVQGNGALDAPKKRSHLGESLETLARQIGTAGVVAAAFCFVFLAGRVLIDASVAGTPLLQPSVLHELMEAVIIAITILVVAIPEGLPLAVTLALAYSVKRMLADNNLVRHLDACETMGCATTICSDKTGTLTTNRQTVVRLWTSRGEHAIPASMSAPLPRDMDPAQYSPDRHVPSSPASSRHAGPAPVVGLRRLVGPGRTRAHPIAAAAVEGGALHTEPLPGRPAWASAAQRYGLVPTLLALADAGGGPEVGGTSGSAAGAGAAPEFLSRREGLDPDQLVLDVACQAVMLNSTAVDQFDKAAGRRKFSGTRTEVALLKLARGCGWGFDALRDAHRELRVLPFSSARKRMTTVVSGALRGGRGDPGRAVVLCKGAAEVVLDKCDRVLLPGGAAWPLDAETKARLLSQSCRSHLRVLAVAFKVQDTSRATEDSEDELESGLTFVLLAGIEDPVREAVPGAIERCQRAGIVVRMLTGDNAITAANIARQCGILREGDVAQLGQTSSSGRDDPEGPEGAGMPSVVTPEGVQALQAAGVVVEGQKFRETVLRPDGSVDWPAFLELWPSLRVMARCTPQDKHLLVTCVRAMEERGGLKEVVAVTGDGTNDAPALRTADVGFAMNSGTAIAKDASDIVLLNDDFQSIVSATKWGRNVFISVRKFLQFQLTVNLVAILTATVSAVALQTSPLSAVQMLWVNLIMDSLASLALATDEPTEEVLEQPPFSVSEPMVTPDVAKGILGKGLYQLAVMYALVFQAPTVLGLAEGDIGSVLHWTMVFNAFVVMQLFNQVNCQMGAGVRSQEDVLRSLTGNGTFLAVVGAELALQAGIVQFGGALFQTQPLSPQQWAVCFGFGALSMALAQALRPLRAPAWLRFG